MKIAVINTGLIGDLVASTGIINGIIAAGHELSIFTRPGLETIFENTTMANFIGSQSHTKFDLSLDLSQSKRSRIMTKKIKAKDRLALASNKKPSLLRLIKNKLTYTRQLALLDPHISDRFDPVFDELAIPKRLPAITLNDPVQKVSGAVAMHIGASNALRILPIPMMIEIIQCLQQAGATVNLLGTESEIVDSINAALRVPVAHIKTSLASLAPTLSSHTMFVGADSGLLHLSAALSIPSIGIYGPNLPRLSAPRSPHIEVIETSLSCRPCDQSVSCPYQRACYTNIPQSLLRTVLMKTYRKVSDEWPISTLV